MRYIDTHAHYNDEIYKENLEEVLEEIKKANVDKIINIGSSINESNTSIQLSKKYDYMYTSIGIHPHSIKDLENVYLLEEMYLKNKDKVVAIGEIGLDYHYTKEEKNEQKQLLIKQIEIAEKYNLPIIIHSRDSSLDTYNIIKEHVKNCKLLFHCFAPTDDLVNLVLEKGYYVAFGGNITYPRNESFKKYIDMIPLDKIVIETDSPYLTPVPFRGKVNNSSYLPYILDKLAEFKNMDKEELSEILYNNSLEFFCLN